MDTLSASGCTTKSCVPAGSSGRSGRCAIARAGAACAPLVPAGRSGPAAAARRAAGGTSAPPLPGGSALSASRASAAGRGPARAAASRAAGGQECAAVAPPAWPRPEVRASARHGSRIGPTASLGAERDNLHGAAPSCLDAAGELVREVELHAPDPPSPASRRFPRRRARGRRGRRWPRSRTAAGRSGAGRKKGAAERRRRAPVDDERVAVDRLARWRCGRWRSGSPRTPQGLDERGPGQRVDRHVRGERPVGVRPRVSAEMPPPTCSQRSPDGSPKRSRPIRSSVSVWRRESGSGTTPIDLQPRVGHVAPADVPGAREEVRATGPRSARAARPCRASHSTPAYSRTRTGPAPACLHASASARSAVVVGDEPGHERARRRGRG